MLNTNKLYFQYVFSKKVILLFILINLLYIYSLIYASGILDGYLFLDLYREEFQLVFLNDFVLVTKISSVVFNVFLISILFKDSCISLSKYLIDKPIKKLYLIWAKIFFALFVSFIVVSLLFEYFFIIYKFFTPYNYQVSELRQLYLAIIIQNCTYVLITFLCMSVISSLLTSILPFGLFWYMELNQTIALEEIDSIGYYLHTYIPIISYNNGAYQLLGNWIDYAILLIFLLILIVLINVNKEIL